MFVLIAQTSRFHAARRMGELGKERGHAGLLRDPAGAAHLAGAKQQMSLLCFPVRPLQWQSPMPFKVSATGLASKEHPADSYVGTKHAEDKSATFRAALRPEPQPEIADKNEEDDQEEKENQQFHD